MNEIQTNSWLMSFVSEQLFGLLVVSSFLALVAIILVSLSRRQSASCRFIIWQMVSGGVVISALVLLALPGVPLRREIVQQNDVQVSLPIDSARAEIPPVQSTHKGLPPKIPFANRDSSQSNVTPKEVASGAVTPTEKLSPFTATRISIAIFVVWSTVSTLLLLRFLTAIICGYRVVKQSHVCKSQSVLEAFEKANARIASRHIATSCLAISNSTSVPFVVGIANPKIVLPVQSLKWPTKKLEMVLSHELAHIERRDILWHWIGQFACCVAWFNPMVWFSACRAVAERERACDDRVIYSGISATEYSSNLVEIAADTCGRRIELAGYVSIAGPPLEQRIGWILSENEIRGRSTLSFTSSIAILFIAISAGASMIRPLATASYAQQPPSAAVEQVQDGSTSEDSVQSFSVAQAKRQFELAYEKEFGKPPSAAATATAMQTYMDKVNGFAKELGMEAGQEAIHMERIDNKQLDGPSLIDALDNIRFDSLGGFGFTKLRVAQLAAPGRPVNQYDGRKLVKDPKAILKLKENTEITFPEGTYALDEQKLTSALRRAKKKFPNGIAFVGSGKEKTTLRITDVGFTSFDIDRLSFRDMTIDCDNDGLFDKRRGSLTLRLSNVRLVRFDAGHGGCDSFSINDGLIVHATDSEFVGGYGRSPGHGSIFDSTDVLLGYFERCIFSGIKYDLFRVIHPRNSILWMDDCKFDREYEIQKNRFYNHGNCVHFEGCIFDFVPPELQWVPQDEE